MTPLTAEKIAELERLLAAATPRPWHRHSECPAECCWHLFEGPDMMYGRPDERGDADGINSPELSDEDSALIVAAINALPSLLSLAKRVAGLADKWEATAARLEVAPGGIVPELAIHRNMRAGVYRGCANDLRALVEIVGGEE